MLTDLKTVEDTLFKPDAMEKFYAKHNIYDVIAFLNKAKKQQSRDRIKYLLSKTSQTSPFYKVFLHAPLTEKQVDKKQFFNYLSSEHSEEYFRMLINREDELLSIIRQNPSILPILFQLVQYENGIKLIKVFKQLYCKHWQEYEKQLLSPQVIESLVNGLGLVSLQSKEFLKETDTVAQMRYAEIIVNIALIGGKCFEFVQKLLSNLLYLYNTQDILLKLALVELIPLLGNTKQTSLLLKNHSMFKLLQKDAFNPEQQLCLRKYVLILLIQLWNQGMYEMSFKAQTQVEKFLKTSIIEKGQLLQNAISLIAALFKEEKGIKLVIKNSDILNRYIITSRSTESMIKPTFLDSVISLTTVSQISQQKKKLTVNVLNCIGNPALCMGLSQNASSDQVMVEGLQKFSQWFGNYLQLPFSQLEMKLVDIFLNLLQYKQVAQSLFQNQSTTKYLLKPINDSNSDKILRQKKNLLLNKIIQKGSTDWKGFQLEEYSRMLQKELKHQKIQVQYALDVQ